MLISLHILKKINTKNFLLYLYDDLFFSFHSTMFYLSFPGIFFVSYLFFQYFFPPFIILCFVKFCLNYFPFISIRFVKYVSAAAPGSRWDIAVEYEIEEQEEEDDDDNDAAEEG